MSKANSDRVVAINRALEKIGNTDAQSAPESQDPMDAVLHEYFVASIGESYFTKRRETAKKTMLGLLSDESNGRIDKAVANTVKLSSGQAATISEAQHYALQLTTKNGAAYFDMDAFMNALRKKVAPEIVDEAVKAGQKRRDPTRSYTVTTREDE